MATGELVAAREPSALRIVVKALHMTVPGSSDVPPWQSAFQQVLDMEHHNKFVQVATVRGDGKPACRTMGFAGFITGTQQGLLQTHAK